MSAAAARVMSADDEARVQAAWRALAAVPDPELPALTLADLGIVRFVEMRADRVLDVGLSPTYTGCPATDHIAELARRALQSAAVGEFAVRHVLAPAWTSDWITPEGRRKLAAYGIVPPAPAAAVSWRSAVALPMPDAAPETKTERPSKRPIAGSETCFTRPGKDRGRARLAKGRTVS